MSEYEFPEAPENIPFNLLRNKGFCETWDLITFQMNCEKFPDRINCLISSHIVSNRIKKILEPFFSKSPIQWLPISLRNKDGETADYYIPHFYEKEDVLDNVRTEFTPRGTIRLPVYSYSKIKDKNCFFGALGELYISEEVRNEIQKVGCSDPY